MANWWTRLPCRLRNDARLAKCGPAAGWVYCCHLTMEADQSLECGPDEKWLAAQCSTTPKEYRKLKAQLVAVGLLTEDGRVIGYAEMQVKDPANSERQARYREKARGRVSGNAPRTVTSNVTGNGAREEKRIEEEEGDSSTTVDDSTRAAAGGAGPESPPGVADAPPDQTQTDRVANRKQQQYAASLLQPHGLTVAGWLADAGEPELMDSHVNAIVAKYKGRHPPPPATGPRAHELPQAPDPDMSDEERAASAAALAAVTAAGRARRKEASRGLNA